MPKRNPAQGPRLLTASEAAAYLGYTSSEVLRAIPVAPIRLATVGVGAGPRYDKVALDRWLDRLSGLHANDEPHLPAEDGETELEEWMLRHARQTA
jgi:hypothetical protein